MSADTRYRAEVWHPELGEPLYSAPCGSYDHAEDLVIDCTAAGFQRGQVEHYVSGIGWEPCTERPESTLNPDWDREQKFEHARQTGRA